jgi:hypothetical protein
MGMSVMLMVGPFVFAQWAGEEVMLSEWCYGLLGGKSMVGLSSGKQ